MSRFLIREAELLKDAQYEPINVLVWGPGKPNEEIEQKQYKKRLQIKAEIEKRFPKAEVRFSEDEDLKTVLPGGSVLTHEAMHAKVAHVVIVLDLSRGADVELDHFIPTYAWFRPKVKVLLPVDYLSSPGLAGHILSNLRPDQIIGFSAEDFDSCKVASELAVNIAQETAVLYRLSS